MLGLTVSNPSLSRRSRQRRDWNQQMRKQRGTGPAPPCRATPFLRGFSHCVVNPPPPKSKIINRHFGTEGIEGGHPIRNEGGYPRLSAQGAHPKQLKEAIRCVPPIHRLGPRAQAPLLARRASLAPSTSSSPTTSAARKMGRWPRRECTCRSTIASCRTWPWYGSGSAAQGGSEGG